MTDDPRAGDWTIYVCNDTCPDFTWGWTEPQVRKALAELVCSHLDEMTRTDSQPPENRDRYNMTAAEEAYCFVEHYPQRKEELIRRIREGRVLVSPYLCNSLWGMQSVEGVLRTFYPARRLEREWGIPIDVAEHIELPSLPWGTAGLLAGCGVRWLSVPFLKYDTTFEGLTNPPVFIFEGPDGGRVRVAMDPWACLRGGYGQGRVVLGGAADEWVAHYRDLGDAYPLRAVLASGTHGDISPDSAGQSAGFADAIIAGNAAPGEHPRFVNATVRQFADAVDEAHSRRPFLPVVRGCFGHSWELWPVSLARIVADARSAEREYLRAEALLATAVGRQEALAGATLASRQRAEWCWAMLGEHAWNGTDDANRHHNADLRRGWARELAAAARSLADRAWPVLGLAPEAGHVSLFNGLSIPRADLVRVEIPPGRDGASVTAGGKVLPSQVVEEDGTQVLYFVSPEMPGFGLAECRVIPADAPLQVEPALAVDAAGLESPFYRLRVDCRSGAVVSLIHKAGGGELVEKGKAACETVYWDCRAHGLTNVTCEAAALGPVLARLRISGRAGAAEVTEYVTVYAGLDRVDFDLHVTKPPADAEERLCHSFAMLGSAAELRVETTGAVIRPRPQPEGDLLPGADTRRLAVQGFVDASLPDGPGVTIAPLDAYALRRDLGFIVFEALGNDQNYKEVSHDQGGEREFRFRYAIQGRAGGWSPARVTAWSRSVASPLLAVRGAMPGGENGLGLTIDPVRAIATCLKPSDDGDGSLILRIQETAGRPGPVAVGVGPFQRAVRTDLLERDGSELPVRRGVVSVDTAASGFAAIRLAGGPGAGKEAS